MSRMDIDHSTAIDMIIDKLNCMNNNLADLSIKVNKLEARIDNGEEKKEVPTYLKIKADKTLTNQKATFYLLLGTDIIAMNYILANYHFLSKDNSTKIIQWEKYVEPEGPYNNGDEDDNRFIKTQFANTDELFVGKKYIYRRKNKSVCIYIEDIFDAIKNGGKYIIATTTALDYELIVDSFKMYSNYYGTNYKIITILVNSDSDISAKYQFEDSYDYWRRNYLDSDWDAGLTTELSNYFTNIKDVESIRKNILETYADDMYKSIQINFLNYAEEDIMNYKHFKDAAKELHAVIESGD